MPGRIEIIRSGVRAPGDRMKDVVLDLLEDVVRDHDHSARTRCSPAHGVLEGAAAHDRETAEIEHEHCMDRGRGGCVRRFVMA